MHQTSITLDEFADLGVDFEVSDKSDFGSVVSMTGHHPDLGPVTAVQDGRNVFLLTERPLAYSRVPDTHSLETAIAWMTQTRSTLQAVHNQPSHGPKSGLESIPRPVRGMLTWLGIDPLIATSREIAYAREIVAHAEEMAALPPAKLAELRAALLSDLRELAA